MSIFDALILGIVQGLSEFLPISSSGHLILAQQFFGIDGANLTFSLTVHAATMIALIVAMRKKLFAQIKNPVNKLNGFILVATLFTALVVICIKKFAIDSFDGRMLPIFFLLTSILLLLSTTAKGGRSIKIQDAIVVGFMQGLAVFPGLSRSGSTIAAARLSGVNEKESTDFSFFISIPIILGSTIIDCLEGGFSQMPFLPLFVGFLSAFITGLFAIKFMLKFLTKNFEVFAIYLFILSAFLILNQYVLGIF